MVFYFSGTGNSQLVAVRIAEMTGDKAVSINRYMKKGEKAVFRSERPLVFVAPVYSWRLPRVVEQWIMENDFEGSRDAYFALRRQRRKCRCLCGKTLPPKRAALSRSVFGAYAGKLSGSVSHPR